MFSLHLYHLHSMHLPVHFLFSYLLFLSCTCALSWSTCSPRRDGKFSPASTPSHTALVSSALWEVAPSGGNCAELTRKVLDSHWLTTQLWSPHNSTLFAHQSEYFLSCSLDETGLVRYHLEFLSVKYSLQYHGDLMLYHHRYFYSKWRTNQYLSSHTPLVQVSCLPNFQRWT